MGMLLLLLLLGLLLRLLLLGLRCRGVICVRVAIDGLGYFRMSLVCPCRIHWVLLRVASVHFSSRICHRANGCHTSFWLIERLSGRRGDAMQQWMD